MAKKRQRGVRESSSYRRRPPSRGPRPRVLVVSEGQETEPRYLRDLCRAHEVRLVCRGIGEDPRRVVRCAVEQIAKAQAAGDPYDAVWAVFDKDKHKTLQEAFATAQSHGIRVAYSNPCFELWFLLHFGYSSAELSPGAVIKALDCADRIPGYSKSMAGIYMLLRNAPEDAAANAEKLRAHHLNAGNGRGANPSTTVDELVECIVELGQGQGPA